ncbi:DUF3237 domain-containing protein [Mycolicibacterium sp.]|uniref:DUF3237 domain-containing protein n=1 Tax=Mycolicibacterium sp. TaxID=2320850 RepID=UPI003D143E4E
MHPFETEHLFTYRAQLGQPVVIGPVPADLRVDLAVLGGDVKGPRLEGTVRPGGADFGTLRPDGVFVIDVRGVLESHDGALIEIRNTGVIDFGPDGYEKFLRGEAPSTPTIRAAPRFLTAHPDYVWLNRVQCIAVGHADLTVPEVVLDAYALR